MAFAGKKKKVLIIVENLPVPFDRRVWQEACALQKNGYQVSIICPTGRNYEKRFEQINGISIYRHPLPLEGSGAMGYLIEYSAAAFWQFLLAVKVFLKHGFDVIQACNPPDTIFLIALFFKLVAGKRFIFDHHDINPELYIAKFNRKDKFYQLLLLLERLTFKTADFSIATNNSYRQIAIERGKMAPGRVAVVRSGPSLERMQKGPANDKWKNGRKYLIGYVGVMGEQEGIDHLIEAVRTIVNEIKRHDIQFVLIGDGTMRSKLQSHVRGLQLEEFITFTGRVSDAQLLEILNTADICVNPDIANDMNDKSTMNKIMEYMALGKPIVQYDLKEGRFSAQKASLYAKRNDPGSLAENMVRLIDEPELRSTMGSFGENRVRKELHWGIESKKYLKVYDKLSAEIEGHVLKSSKSRTSILSNEQAWDAEQV